MFPVGSRSRNRGRGFAFNRGAKVPPSFVFDFLRGSLDSRITYTGANGTLFNSSGTLTAATTNVPRLDYNPSTLIARGLLIEEARTNLFLNSLINGTNLSTQNVTTAATPYTLSFYGTGTITLSGTSVGSLVGSGAYPIRSTLTFTPSAGTLTCTVTGTVQYAQIEAGSFATSFIPTAGVTVTRAADLASITGANFTSFWNATQGTIVARGITYKPAVGGQAQDLVSVSDATFNNTMDVRFRGNSVTGSQVITGGVTQADLSSGSWAINTSYTAAFAYAANNFAQVSTGGNISTDAAGTVPTVTQLTIGASAIADSYLNGWISSLSYYPVRLPDSELRSLSA